MNRNLTILVAEDDENEAFLLKRSLTKAGINNPVQVVSDGQESIDYLAGTGRFGDRKEFPFPSVIILDLKMPRVNGFEVLKWLRQHPTHAVIPVIVMTNSNLPGDIRRAYELGANSYIVKPHGLQDLVRALRLVYEYWALCEKPPFLPH